METAIVWVAIIAFIGFRQWLQHQRRTWIHKERLAAIEKGVELPPLEQEVKRSTFNMQRILLLMGLIWIFVGIGVYIAMTAILQNPKPTDEIRPGMQYLAVIPVGVGLAHLVTLLVGPKRDDQAKG